MWMPKVEKTLTLKVVKPGKSMKVVEIHGKGAIRQRIMDRIVKEAEITVKK
jgi:Fe2+ transport system protein FeoA